MVVTHPEGMVVVSSLSKGFEVEWKHGKDQGLGINLDRIFAKY